MVRNASIALVLFSLALGPVDCLAQQTRSDESSAPRDTTPFAEKPTDDSLDQLSRRSYSRRQQATLEMWRQRELTREKVQEAARHPDPEVSGRAKWILRQWRRGALPDTPPEISRLLQRADGPVPIERLLEGGQFTAAMVAIEESAGTVDREAILESLTEALRLRFPIYIHRAIQSESLPQLLELIEMVADSKELAVCRLQLLKQMGMNVTDDALLPRSSSQWSQLEIQRAMALVLITLGRLDDAIAVAAESVDEDLLRQCRMIASQWKEVAQQCAVSARAAEPGSYPHVRQWCWTLIAADRARDAALVAEAVEVLSTTDPDDDKAASELRWKCLASHAHVDAALMIAEQSRPDAAASISMDASIPKRAFEALDYPLDQIDLEIDSWIADAIAAQEKLPYRELTQEVRNLLALMQCLISIGREDAAWEIARQLSESQVNVGTLRLREFVLSTLTITRRTDWLTELAVGETERVMSQTSQYTVAKTLPSTDMVTMDIVMRALATMMGNETLKSRFQAAYTLLDGEIPVGFDPDVHFRRLYEFVTRHQPSRQRVRTTRRLNILANMNIVHLFARHGQSELASATLRKLIDSGDLEALFYLAEQELDGGRADAAMALFESVFNTVLQQGRDSSKSFNEDDTALAVKALIGRWTVARRLGDEQLSAQLEQQIRLSLCSPSMQLRYAVAEYLAQRGESRLAMEAFEVLLPMALTGGSENTRLYDVARSYSTLALKSNVSEASRWFDLALNGTLETMDLRPGAYITLPLYVRRWALEDAIQQRDRDRARRHLDRILQLDPLDIDFAERLLPEMRTADMPELANETLHKIIDFGVAYTQSFPFDAMTANNLAWVAAMNQQRLDDALQLSESAVYVEPDSAIYRDTLAEVLFLQGRKQEALLVEQSCLLDDPGQWHLHEQIEKYSEAIQAEGVAGEE